MALGRDRALAWSSVAPIAVHWWIERPRGIDVALVHESHVRHLGHRANEFAVALLFMNVAVAIEAPAHAERLDHAHLLHLVDAPMAFGTTDPAGHVNAVIEIDVVRKLVDPHPLHGLVRLPALPNGLEQLGVGLDQLMAV